jgi:hypothetical protein
MTNDTLERTPQLDSDVERLLRASLAALNQTPRFHLAGEFSSSYDLAAAISQRLKDGAAPPADKPSREALAAGHAQDMLRIMNEKAMAISALERTADALEAALATWDPDHAKKWAAIVKGSRNCVARHKDAAK